MRVEAGDIVCYVHPRNIISRLVSVFQTAPFEGATKCHHVGIIVDDGDTDGVPAPRICEALHTVKIHNFKPSNRTMIWRSREPITPHQKLKLRGQAFRWLGRRYSYGKIALHLLDWCIGGVYFFRRMAFLPNRPICSYLVAKIMKDSGLSCPWEAKAVQPDDILDTFERNNAYVQVKHDEATP
jgi:hypothetical protein